MPDGHVELKRVWHRWNSAQRCIFHFQTVVRKVFAGRVEDYHIELYTVPRRQIERRTAKHGNNLNCMTCLRSLHAVEHQHSLANWGSACLSTVKVVTKELRQPKSFAPWYIFAILLWRFCLALVSQLMAVSLFINSAPTIGIQTRCAYDRLERQRELFHREQRAVTPNWNKKQLVQAARGTCDNKDIVLGCTMHPWCHAASIFTTAYTVALNLWSRRDFAVSVSPWAVLAW